MNKKTYTSGFTLIETLVYLFVMVILLSAVMYFMLQVIDFYRYITLSSRVDQTASSLLQVVAIDIRAAADIDEGNSTFSVPASVVTLDQADGSEVVYQIADGALRYTSPGVSANLTPGEFTVSEFRVTNLSSAVSEAIRVTIGLSFSIGEETYESRYSNVVVLRQSYE